MTVKHSEYICIKDDQLQDHSRKLERLEARSESRETTIKEIKVDMDKMDKKLDALLEGFNELKLESTKDDKNLELRLKAIETELQTQKLAVQDSRNRFTLIISIVTIFFTALTFIFNFLLK